MKSEFEIAITQLSADRNLAPEVILEAIEIALVSAYKRNFGSGQNVSVKIDSRTGRAQVLVKRVVVEKASDQDSEIPLAEARTYDADAEIGGFVEIEVKPRNFGRIAAQTAKQVITQRIREAERDSVYLEYAERVGEIVNGTVRNIDSRSNSVIVGLGKAEALLPRSEQIFRENYRFGQRLRAYLSKVEKSARGPQIVVSRTHPEFLRRLLELEVPEIYSGTVEVKAIAREPGFRSKVAVAALQTGVDPVGSCVGMRGVRIQNIVNELSGEKIDVVAWSADESAFIANALSPARVVSVRLHKEEKTAEVVVPDRALSLAIGKEGQNARLAAKLTGWRIDIKSETEAAEEAERLAKEMEEVARREQDLEEARLAAAALLAEAQAAWDEQVGQPVEEVVVSLAEPEVADTEEMAEVVDLESEEVGEVAELEPELAVEMVPQAVEATDGEAPAEAVDDQAPVEEEAVPSELAPLVLEDLIQEPQPEPQEVVETEAEAEEVPEWEEDGELSDEDWNERSEKERESDRRKRLGRLLEYDEQLGRVVARKRHKRRGKRSWDAGGDEWDETP